MTSPPPLTAADCRRERDRRGWTAEQLALRAGLAVLTIQKFEAGATRPRLGTFVALRRAFAQAD